MDDCMGMLLVGDTDAEAANDGDAEPDTVPVLTSDGDTVVDEEVDTDAAKLTDVLGDGEVDTAAVDCDADAEGLVDVETEAVPDACDTETLREGVVDIVGALLVGDTDGDDASEEDADPDAVAEVDAEDETASTNDGEADALAVELPVRDKEAGPDDAETLDEGDAEAVKTIRETD